MFRPSSQLQILPEMDGISEEEREHIQTVLDRANSPYVLPRRPGSALSRPSQNIGGKGDAATTTSGRNLSLSEVNNAEIDENASMTVETLETKGELPVPSSSRDTPKEQDTVTAGSLFMSFFGRAKAESPSPAKEKSPRGAEQTPVISNVKKESITQRIERSKEGKNSEYAAMMPGTVNAIERTEEHLRNVGELEEGTIELNGDELTAAELEHIRRIQEMAESDSQMATRIDPVMVKDSVEREDRGKQAEVPDLSAEELEHIRRIQEMAEMDTNLTELIKDKTTGIDTVDGGLTVEELDHIRRIQEMAELEMGGTEEIMKEPQLSAEELEHILRVQEIAEAESRVPPLSVTVPASKMEEYELSEEELAHIRRIEAMANMDEDYSWSERESEKMPADDSGLTAEEMEHILRVAELAELEAVAPQPPHISPEMEERPLADGYDVVQFDQVHAPLGVEFLPTLKTHVATELDTHKEEELINDMEQQRKMERRASYDAHYPRDVFDDTEYSPGLGHDLPIPGEYETELTEEELTHIRRVQELAERASIYAEQGTELSSEDLKKFTEEKRLLRGGSQSYLDEEEFNGEFTPGEMEEIRRISERDEEGLPEEMPTYDLPTPDYGHTDITFYPEADGSGPDPADELNSHILDRSSPAKDGSGGVGINYGGDSFGHPPYESSPQVADEEMSFDIKEVREMPRDERLGRWYETQLSFVRDTIADEGLPILF